MLNSILQTILSIIGFAILTTVAVDVFGFAMTPGSREPSSANLVNSLVEGVIDLPIKVVKFIFALVAIVLEASVKLIFGLIGMSKLVQDWSIDVSSFTN